MKKIISSILVLMFLTPSAFAAIDIEHLPVRTQIPPQEMYTRLNQAQIELQKLKDLVAVIKSGDKTSLNLESRISSTKDREMVGLIGTAAFAYFVIRSMPKDTMFIYTVGGAASALFGEKGFEDNMDAIDKADVIAKLEKLSPEELETFSQNVDKQIETIKQAKLNIEGAFQ